MQPSADLPIPQSNNRSSRLKYLLRWILRWFYRFVFVFIGLGIVGSLIEAFVVEWFTSGKLDFPPFQSFYLVQIAQNYPFYFELITTIVLLVGILGYINHRHFTKTEKIYEERHLASLATGVSAVAAGQVLEEKVPDITQRAVKQGLEEAAIIQDAIKKGFQKALKEHTSTNTETTSSKLPMDIASLPLPPAVSGLIGREKDQEWLNDCILAGKIVEITGMGGVGKTTLVSDTIHKIAPLFQGGAIAAIRANDETNPIIILRQLVEKLVPNAQELLSRSDTRVSLLYDALSSTLSMHRQKENRILIVIDGVGPAFLKNEGLEHLCNIFRSTQVSVVMTTRERLSTRLVQESRELEVFTDEAAVDLLTRLLEGFLDRQLSDGERLDAVSICKIAGNHAQAIVLIAGYLEHHSHTSLASYLQRLKHSPKMVLDLTDRLQPIDAARGVRLTFASSYSQLEESAQHLFIALGALSGSSCSCEALQALGAALKQSEDVIHINLASLIHSKLVLKPFSGHLTEIQRIHLHPLVHEFARELLRSSDEFHEDTFYEALAAHYAEWVPSTSEDTLSDDDANLMAALRWAKGHMPQADSTLARLIYNLRWYWRSKYQFEAAFEWLQTGCEVMERLGPDWHEQRGELLFVMGAQYQWIGELSEAEHYYKKSNRIFSKIGSKVGQGEALSGLAALAQQKGEIEKAQRNYEKSLAIFRKARDQRGEADVRYRLGFLALRIGDTDAALQYYTDSLKLHLALGNDQWGESLILYSLGAVYQQIGKIDKALTYYTESLTLCKQTSNRRTESLVLKALGDLALQTTGPADAEKYLSESSTISQAIFDLQSQSVELYSMAFLFRQIGKNEDAQKCYRESLEIREQIKDERGRGYALKGLGDLSRRIGDMTTAQKQLEECLEISLRIKDRRCEGIALKALGDWACQAGDVSTAENSYQVSLLVCQDCHDLRGEAIALKALGDVSLIKGDRANAQAYFTQSLGLFRQMQDLRGQGATLHSLGVLALELGDKTTAETHLEQSLELLRQVQDRPSEAAALYALALWAEARGDLALSEKLFRESLQIVIEIDARPAIAVFQEAFGDFLLRHNNQKDRKEGNELLDAAAASYRSIGRMDDAEHVEERRVARYRVRERDRIMRALIYDLDQGPNGQGFAVPHERRSAHRPT